VIRAVPIRSDPVLVLQLRDSPGEGGQTDGRELGKGDLQQHLLLPFPTPDPECPVPILRVRTERVDPGENHFAQFGLVDKQSL
jgi:hypothetical protein